MTTNLPDRILRRLFRARKSLHQRLSPWPDKRSVLFILGCQRSGTTLLSEIFERDLDCRSYGEFSELNSLDGADGIRLNPLPIVRAQLEKVRAPLIVLKPLVESQNAIMLLDGIENSTALWVYRNYRDVALSNSKKFSALNSINFLRSIVNNESNNWRSERVSEETRRIVHKYYSRQMNAMDAQVLCWYSRNILFFDQELERRSDVLLCSYDKLVSNPAEQVKLIYDRVDQQYPGAHIVSATHARSIGRGQRIELTTEIDKLASDLLSRLDALCESNGRQR
jgi:hypothetical protein